MHDHKHSALRGLAVVASVLACTAALGAGPAALAASSSPASASVSADLRAVSAASATDAWAVGYEAAPGPQPVNARPLALRWNGTRWTKIATPNPGNAFLSGVSTLSATDAWAVGYNVNAIGYTLPVIMHWNGTTWKQVPSPNPYGPFFTPLRGVSAVSATNAWAVGTYVDPTGNGLSLILHWNGTTWKQVPSPSPCPGCHPDIALDSVSAVSATDAWAVGYNTGGASAQSLILHWNGTSWKQVPSPNPGGTMGNTYLTGVATVSAKDAWVTGYYHTTGLNNLPLLLHWNGTSWTRVTAPSPGGPTGTSAPVAVSAISSTSALAAGWYNTRLGNFRSLALRWNGTRWTQVTSPNPGGTSFLGGVAATSAASAWAVGYYGTSNGPTSLILRWNGTTWKQVSAPS